MQRQVSLGTEMQRLWTGDGEHSDRRGNGAIWDMGIRESYALRGRPPALPCLAAGMLVVLQGKERGMLSGKKESEYVHMAPPISLAGLLSQTHSLMSASLPSADG